MQADDPLSPAEDPVVVSLVELFRLFMGLKEDQVVIYNQDWNIPPDDRLYLTIAFLAAKPFGSSNAKSVTAAIPAQPGQVPTPAKMVEAITVQMQETYTINVMSSTNEAMIRHWEITAALNSTMGQQAQEEIGYALARNAISVVDLSALEGSARLFRYAITLTLLRSRTRENVIAYYDKFTGSPDLHIEP